MNDKVYNTLDEASEASDRQRLGEEVRTLSFIGAPEWSKGVTLPPIGLSHTALLILNSSRFTSMALLEDEEMTEFNRIISKAHEAYCKLSDVSINNTKLFRAVMIAARRSGQA